MKYETHENIYYDVDENDLYHIDKMSLDEKKWRKRAFEREIEYTYDIKRQNGKSYIHENEVNKIAECNLLHDILNPYKRTKNVNSPYSPIIHVCMNTRKGKAKFKKF